MSDHPFRPLGLPGPRPRKWSLTPRCLCLSRRGSSWDTTAVAQRLCGPQLARSRPARCSRSASPMLRMAVGLDRATRRPVSGLLSTAAAEVLDDERRRYCRILFAGCDLQPPPHRPVWSTFESLVSGHGSFPKSPIHFLVVCSCDVTSANPMIEPDCVSASGQAQIRPCNHVEVVTLPRRYVGQSRSARSCTQCARSEQEQRSRQSKWAGVSWPRDDDHERDAAGATGLTLVRTTRHAVTPARTRRFAHSFVRWRGKRHGSASSWN